MLIDRTLRTHPYTGDEFGYCTVCGLPEKNRHHAPTPEAAGAGPARPVVTPHQRDTSIDAALRSWQTNPTIRGIVFRALVFAKNGLTDDELFGMAALKDKNPNTIRPRRIELAQAGLIEPLVRDGKPVTRATKGGSPATVWTLTDRARAAVQGYAA